MRRTLFLLPLSLALVSVTVASASGLPMAEEWTFRLDGARIFNAVIILGIAGWLAVKFGGPMLKNRAASIANEISELEQAKKQAEEQMREFEARLRQIEREAEAITAEAKAEGELIKGKIIAQAEESAKRIVEKAAGQIALETEGAKRRLHEETMKAAVAMAEEVIRKNINNDDQKRLFKSYVENMGKMN